MNVLHARVILDDLEAGFDTLEPEWEYIIRHQTGLTCLYTKQQNCVIGYVNNAHEWTETVQVVGAGLDYFDALEPDVRDWHPWRTVGADQPPPIEVISTFDSEWNL